MDEATRQKILDESRNHLAHKDALTKDLSRRALQQPVDVMKSWREQAAVFEREAEQGRRELREREREMLRQSQADAATIETQVFNALAPIVEEIASATTSAIDALCNRIAELHEQMRKQERELTEARIETAKLATRFAEMQTDRVLAAMPGASTLRSVN